MRTAWMACLALISCGGGETQPTASTFDGWELRVSAPVVAGTSVSGSFTTSGEGTRGFGACLLADLHGSKECTSSDDCAADAPSSLGTEHTEYCLTPSGESKARCWMRGVDAAWCNKAPPPGRAAGTFATPTVDASTFTASGQKTRFVTLVCFNAATYPAFSDGPRPPCASGDPAAAAYRAQVVSASLAYTAP